MRPTGTVTEIHPEQHVCIITRDDGGGEVRVPLVAWEAYRCLRPFEVGQRFHFLVIDGLLGPVGVNLCLERLHEAIGGFAQLTGDGGCGNVADHSPTAG